MKSTENGVKLEAKSDAPEREPKANLKVGPTQTGRIELITSQRALITKRLCWLATA